MKSVVQDSLDEFEFIDGIYTPESLEPLRKEMWVQHGSLWKPRSLKSRTGSSLTVSRPFTAYRKIVDIFAANDQDFSTILLATIDDILSDNGKDVFRPIVIKFEEHPNLFPLPSSQKKILADLGFTESKVSIPSVPSTRTDSPSYTAAWNKWLSYEPSKSVNYYGQTTDITCGPSASLMLLDLFSSKKLTDNHVHNQINELEIWRKATNLVGCDPYTLTSAISNEISLFSDTGLQTKLVLNTDGPVLVEPGTAEDNRFRTIIQLGSQKQLFENQTSFECKWFEVEELSNSVKSGTLILLMINLELLTGESTPHWVLVHEVNEDCLIISDPWVDQAQGESWVDSHYLPIPFEVINRIAQLGEPVTRGYIEVAKN